jgi:hypothetical protein
MTALESKLQKAQESVEDAETQMKLMVSEMEATSLNPTLNLHPKPPP